VRHRKKSVKLKREKAPREALLRSLARSVLLHESITTTLAKAKAVQPFVERLITTGKRKDRNAARQIDVKLGDAEVSKKLLSGIADRFAEREGGYTRVRRVGYREGDGAEMAMLSLITEKKK